MAACLVVAASASATPPYVFFIKGVSAIPGVSYTPVTSSEPINLDGHGVDFFLDTSWECANRRLPAGQVYTVISTTGGLTGTLETEGGEVELWLEGQACPNDSQKMQISYHETGPVQTVTAAVVGGSSTPLSALEITSEPSSKIVTNEPVTLTATVGTSAGIPEGTVAFDGYPAYNPLPGCANQPVVKVGSAFEATCTTQFSVSGKAEEGFPHVRAVFSPNTDEELLGSHTGYGPNTKAAGTTSTVTASNTTPTTGEDTTYTATVTPEYLGPLVPTGTVGFFDDGQPIVGCTSQPVSPSGQTSTATCQVSYATDGAQSITASYSGDENFTASGPSIPQSVTVQTRTTLTGTEQPPAGGGSSETGGSSGPPTHVSSPRAYVALSGRSIAVWHDRVALVTLRCSDATCAGKITATAWPPRPHRPAQALGVATFSIAAGHAATLRLDLTQDGRKLLEASHGRLKASLTAYGASHRVQLEAIVTLR